MIFHKKLLVLCRPSLSQIIKMKSTMPESCLKNIKAGQPTAETHPHLLKPGEILPGIKISEFQDRRQNLVKEIIEASKTSKATNHLIIIPSATKKYMSDKIPYVFRQNSDYLYLSGCLEPDSCLVINTKKNSTDHCSTLFVRNPDSHSELWDGPRTSVDAAPLLFGVDQSLPMSDLISFLSSYISSVKHGTALWYDIGEIVQSEVDKSVRELLFQKTKLQFDSPKYWIHKLRLIKSPAEINLMRRTSQIASEAINTAMAISKPNITEHQLFATVDYECRMKGAEYLAYPPVVAGGERATIIHYINNNQQIMNGEMLLMDAGCEYHSYTSDITRTWPINGKFTPEQKLLYEIVQSVQADLINILYNFPTLDHLFDSMCVILGKRMQQAGLIPHSIGSEALFKTAYEFCPHHVSHYLGMDVHDTSLIKRNISLQPGMIITIEPGIYISDRHNVPPQFKGLGIRIEDDVLITENGPEILTAKCLKNVSDIENQIGASR